VKRAKTDERTVPALGYLHRSEEEESSMDVDENEFGSSSPPQTSSPAVAAPSPILTPPMLPSVIHPSTRVRRSNGQSVMGDHIVTAETHGGPSSQISSSPRTQILSPPATFAAALNSSPCRSHPASLALADVHQRLVEDRQAGVSMTLPTRSTAETLAESEPMLLVLTARILEIASRKEMPEDTRRGLFKTLDGIIGTFEPDKKVAGL
jgi:hypothetical protein